VPGPALQPAGSPTLQDSHVRRKARTPWRAWSTVTIFLAVSRFATAQSGQPAEPDVVLKQALVKMRDMIQRLPKYACVETVERRYFQVAPGTASSCAQPARNRRGDSQQLEGTDRLRLEVTISEDREIYSWPGATRFDSRDVSAIIRQGPIGTGSFGTHLFALLKNPSVLFQVAAQQARTDRKIEYRFHVPLQASHYSIRDGGTSIHVGYDGTLWLDEDSLTVQRLTFHTTEVPRATSICNVEADLDYQQVSNGPGDVSLPSRSELRIARDDGRVSNNVTSFSDCREYQAESALLFEGDPQVQENSAAPAVHLPIRLPIGLSVTLALTAPIDSETAAAGDLVSATVVQAVRQPGSNSILIPAGATVRGRLTRVERHLLPTAYFLIALSFNRFEVGTAVAPFAARHEANDELARELGLSGTDQGGFGFWDMGTFLFPTFKDRYVIPAGFKSKWMTLATRSR
jgi:hypothetical protein